MTHSELEIKDLVLSDRLRELGLNYVADVLEGKKQPSASQLMFMITGSAFPLRQATGTLLVGGARDGEHVPFNPEEMLHIQIPVPMNYARQYRAQDYRAVGMRGQYQSFRFYLFDEMEPDEGYRSLLTNYRSPNSVENHHGQG